MTITHHLGGLLGVGCRHHVCYVCFGDFAAAADLRRRRRTPCRRAPHTRARREEGEGAKNTKRRVVILGDLHFNSVPFGVAGAAVPARISNPTLHVHTCTYMYHRIRNSYMYSRSVGSVGHCPFFFACFYSFGHTSMMENDGGCNQPVRMRTRQQPREEQPTSFVPGAGVVRGRNWSVGAQFGEGSTSCADHTDGHSPNTTNGSLQCQPWIGEENNMMSHAVPMDENDGRADDDTPSSAAQGCSQEFRRSPRRRMIATASPGKHAFLFAIISFLFLASLAPPSTVPSASVEKGASASCFGFSRFAAYAANNDDQADAEEEEEDENQVNKYDDDIVDLADISFDEVSVMPVSCLRYNNGHMIKFEFFENSSNYQCHFKNLGTFVVSIGHYMRAYFNHQALVKGRNFKLPGDAGYLNCVMLQETANSDQKLYAKIGCMERETFTSTKLQLHLYTDAACSVHYDDGRTKKQHVKNGYDVNGLSFGTKVSFRPPFYTCQTCQPDYVSDSFRKSSSYWYDDDYISENGKRRQYDDDANGDDDDANKGDDDDTYFQYGDDAYDPNYQGDDDYYLNDDANNDDGGGWSWSNWAYKGESNGWKGNQGGGDDDVYNRRGLREYDPEEEDLLRVTPVPDQLEAFENEFWSSVWRQLEDGGGDDDDAAANDDASIDNWNMCGRIHNYGMWCDQECRALDTFRVDEWSASDVFLLVVMCLFMASMMLLIFAKRVKAYEKASVYGDDIDQPYPGLPPMAMILVFILITTIILVLANLKFVNETLVFAVVVCILLFIYMLKLTLFERKSGPALLPTPGQSYFS